MDKAKSLRLQSLKRPMNETLSPKPRRAKTVAKALSTGFAETEQGNRDPRDRSDRWLIARVRRDPVNVQAVEALIDRHWKQLFAKCAMLTANSEGAIELAEAALRRTLQARQALDPSADFLAHLIVTATNLWREQNQSLQLPEALSANGNSAPGTPPCVGDGAAVWFTSLVVADLESLSGDEQARLKQEIDAELGRLTPRDRDAVLSRYLI